MISYWAIRTLAERRQICFCVIRLGCSCTMKMFQYYLAFWISLLVLSLVKNSTSKPFASSHVGAPSAISADDYAVYEYSDDWTFRSSGYMDYAEEDVITRLPCPEICTCVVETILYCSRQEIKFVGSQKESNSGITLGGPIPKTTKSIHLGYNNISVLPIRLFEDLMENGPSKISDLYLQNNHIIAVHPDAFMTLVDLKNLDLSNNRITHIVQSCEGAPDVGNPNASCIPGIAEASFLRSLAKGLISLNLNGNLIRGIPNYSFEFFSSLKVLRLSFNRITWISRKAFYGLVQLRVLQIRSNPLGAKTALKLGDILQHFIPQTRPVKLNSSQLENFEFYTKRVDHSPPTKARKRDRGGSGTIHSRVNGEHETIPVNSLEDLDLGQINLARFPAVIPSSVKRLYLDSNSISTISKQVLETMKGIELLQLGGNRIAHISDATFSPLHNLRVLDLSRNNLTKLTQNTFSGLLRLASLRLYGNRQLSELPGKVFWSLPFLRVLYLHNCNLTALPRGPWMFRILALWLYGNPIECNCQNLLSLLERIYRPVHPRYTLRLDPYRSVLWDDSDTWKYQRPVKTTCAAPRHFRGHKLGSIRVTDLRCTYQDHYEAEIARQISSSRFLSSDYQQDQSTAAQISQIENMAQLMNDYKGIKHGNISSDKLVVGNQCVASNNTARVAIPKRVDVVVDSSATEQHGSYQTSNGGENIDVTMSQNTVFKFESNPVVESDFSSLKKYETDKEQELINQVPEEKPREWLSIFTGNTVVDQEGGEESNQNVKNTRANVFPFKRHNVKAGMPEISAMKMKESSYDLEIEIRGKLETGYASSNSTYDNGGDEQNSYNDPFPVTGNIWKSHLGLAEYEMYDDGDIEPDMDSILRFADEKSSTLNENYTQRLRNEMLGVNAWKSYQEYYGGMESSGDFEATSEFAAHVKNLRAAGASAEELIGNLTKIYNISEDYLDYESYSVADQDIGSLAQVGDW